MYGLHRTRARSSGCPSGTKLRTYLCGAWSGNMSYEEGDAMMIFRVREKKKAAKRRGPSEIFNSKLEDLTTVPYYIICISPYLCQ